MRVNMAALTIYRLLSFTFSEHTTPLTCMELCMFVKILLNVCFMILLFHLSVRSFSCRVVHL